jgi:hypothetical protein
MSKAIASDIKVVVNGSTLSNWAFKVDVPLQKEKVEVSGFNSTASREFLPGQSTEEFIVSFRQDFGSSAVDQTLWPLYNTSTAFVVSCNPTSATASATNPTYSGTCNLYEYHPLDADLGNASETTVTFAINGGVTRATA